MPLGGGDSGATHLVHERWAYGLVRTLRLLAPQNPNVSNVSKMSQPFAVLGKPGTTTEALGTDSESMGPFLLATFGRDFRLFENSGRSGSDELG